MRFLKDSKGQPSASFTMMITTFVICLLWLMLSIFENLGPIKIRAFSGSDVALILIPLCSLYFGRRLATDKVNVVNLIEGGKEESIPPAPVNNSNPV